jgi:hypothetical protein
MILLLCIFIFILILINQYYTYIETFIQAYGLRVNPIEEDNENIVYIWIGKKKIPIGYMYNGIFYPKFMRRF